MEPIGFEIEQTSILPPHEVVVLAKDQPQYRPLPIARIHGREGRCISRWTLTPEERKAIAEGADLYLEQLTFNRAFQPILPTVDLRDLCPMDLGKAES